MSKGYYNNPIDGGEHVREQLSDYMDGLLSGEDRRAVRSHLEECADCRADYIELRATRRAMHSMPAVAVPRAFTLTPEMAGRVRRPSFWDALFVHRNAPRLAAGSLVAFLLLAIFIGNDFLGYTGSPQAEPLLTAKSSAPSASGGAAQTGPVAESTATTASSGGDQARIASEPTQQPSAEGTAMPAAPIAPEPGTSAAGMAAPTASGPEVSSAVPPDTSITASGNSSPTTTTLESPSAGGEYDITQAPPGPAPSPANNINAGLIALQASLFVVALGLAAAAVIAWRRH